MSNQYNNSINIHYNQTVGGSQNKQKNGVLSLGTIGDILTGTVVKGGTSPIVEMNGTPIKVRSSVLQNAQPGEQIYLEITGSNSSEITMKIVDQDAISITGKSGITQTEILKNTAQFVENWKQATQNQNSEYGEMQEEAKLLLDTISDEEREKLRQMGIDISSSNLTFVKSLLSQLRGQEQDEELQQAIESVRKQIALENPQEHPEEFRLVIQESSMNVSQATKEANDCLPISEEQTVYLIQNQLPLTIDNLYKSEYSGKHMPAKGTLSEAAFNQMLPQIQRAIQTAGMKIDGTSLDAARFLLNHNLPVNTDSLRTYAAIQDMNENGFQESQIGEQFAEQVTEEVVQEATEEVAHTISTAETDSLQEEAPSTKEEAVPSALKSYRHMELYFPTATKTANQIAEDFKKITEEGFWAFADTGLPFTLENLSVFCQNLNAADPAAASSGASAPEYGDRVASKDSASASLQALTAHRQLEELRLKMTWEASYALASEDIHIRARELSQVVEALRNQERDYYKEQFRSEGMEPTADTLKLVQDTNSKVQDLPYLPASALGATLFSGAFTIDRLHENGMQALQESNTTLTYTKVASYETLMTSPRSDMGDSIQKAFRNVDAILDDLNLPTTEENQRAVRILGYNQMEITPEHLEQVKAADGQVQTLIQNLQPSVVLSLVRDGVNPLSMPIEELNALVENYIHEEGITDEGKYSEFLQKLDRKGDISQQERNGYIGIYRLLDKVTKSKGKDIGTLIRNNQPVTLQNLLTAHRSNRATGMDAVLDESFGGLDVTTSDDSISKQILDGFGSTFKQSQEPESSAQQTVDTSTASDALADDSLSDASLYQQQVAEQLLNRITPELIDQMVEESAKGSTLEELFDTIERQLAEEPAPSETATSVAPEVSAETAVQEQLLQGLDSFDESTYQFMKTMQIFPSITNMALSADILKGRNRTFQTADALSQADGDTEEISAQIEGLTEHLNSPEEMEQAYAKLESTITEQVHEMDITGTITAKDIQALKQVRAGLRIMQKMSRNEQFQIPFSVNGEWNIINLSVIRDTETKGLLQADVPTQEYGTISTTLSWVQDHWEGSLSAEHPEGIAFLDRHSDQLTSAIEQITSADRGTEVGEAPTTNEMYRMAKQLIVLIKHMEL